jgi:hypothetical protein
LKTTVIKASVEVRFEHDAYAVVLGVCARVHARRDILAMHTREIRACINLPAMNIKLLLCRTRRICFARGTVAVDGVDARYGCGVKDTVFRAGGC